MNKVFLIGRLTRDPELRYTGSNTAVASFSIAVNRNFANAQGEREADFINIVVWRKQAENVKNYLTQGSQVAIDGRIQTRSYDDKNSATNSNSGSTEKNMGPTPYDFGTTPEPKGIDVDSNPFADFGSSIEISDDELPF